MTIYSYRICERRPSLGASGLVLAAFGLLAFLSGCRQSRGKAALDIRMDSAVDQIHRDINKRQDPTSGQGRGVTPPARLQPAYLGYAYPPKLVRGEARIFYAYVTVRNDAAILHENLQTTVADEEGTKAVEDTIVIYPRDISFFRSIHLVLTDPSGDFQITPIHASDTQVIHIAMGNRWQWSVITQTDKPTATLLLKAEGIQSEGASESLEARVIPIRISIKPYIIRTFFNYLTDHPAVSVPILVSFLGFIGWLIRYFLKKKVGDKD